MTTHCNTNLVLLYTRSFSSVSFISVKEIHMDLIIKKFHRLLYLSLTNREFRFLYFNICLVVRLPRWFSGKESTCQAGNMSLIPGSGRSPREGNGNSLQYFCQGNPMDRGAWRARVHGVAKSQTRLSD